MTQGASPPASEPERLEALEFKVAYLERALQELSDAVYRQQQLLEAIDGRYQRLLDRVEASERSAESPGGFEIPPHY